MAQKFKSRKFWLAVTGGILVILNDGLGLNIDSETILSFTGIIISYILGESYIDSKK